MKFRFPNTFIDYTGTRVPATKEAYAADAAKYGLLARRYIFGDAVLPSHPTSAGSFAQTAATLAFQASPELRHLDSPSDAERAVWQAFGF